MIDDIFNEDELSRLGDLLKTADELEEEQGKVKKVDLKNVLGEKIVRKVDQGESAHEVVRDVVFDAVKSIYSDDPQFEKPDPEVDVAKVIDEKRNELVQILDNLDVELAGKSIHEVAATFTSLLDIQSQLCMQKTEGVITVRTRLINFFPTKNTNSTPAALRQEINLIFSPEEISAIRAKTLALPEKDPMRPFFTTVLDQAYDVVQYNEMSGNLLLEMTHYFLNKLAHNGYGDTSKYAEFQERFSRAKMSLMRAIEELRDAEKILNKHLTDRPILQQIPRLLRLLIHIKIGLSDPKQLNKVLEQIKSNMGQYARARSAVAFDFNRLPSYQHGVRLRQSVILNLQKDVLQFTGEAFEKEFAHAKAEFDRMMEEIEASSGELEPGTPEYEELIQRKARIQEKLEQQRRKLDIVKSQEKMVNVQHTLVGAAIKRYQKEEALHQKLESQMESTSSIDEEKVRNVSAPTKKKVSRMVMARRNR